MEAAGVVLLKSSNPLGVLRKSMRWIGAIRSKAEVETRIEHVEFEYLVLMSKSWGEVRWARRTSRPPA